MFETMEHTKTPWKVNSVAEHAFAATITDENGGVLIAKTAGLDTFHDYQNCEQENANARRIVAAVNACEGIETERLENGGRLIFDLRDKARFFEDVFQRNKEIEALQAQNARLLEALKEISVFLPETDAIPAEKYDSEQDYQTLLKIHKIARAAIAEAENQPQTP